MIRSCVLDKWDGVLNRIKKKKVYGKTYKFIENDQGIVKEFSHQIETISSYNSVEG